MMMPTLNEIEQLHRKYAPTDETFDLIYTHCLIVRDIALWAVDSLQLNADREMVEVGALLHDIGVYKLYDKSGKEISENYLRHGISGYEILKSEGYDEVICRFASHHTGVGITRAEIVANKLPLPEEDFLADSTEELLVMYADKFHSKDIPPCFNTVEWYAKHVARFGVDKSNAFLELVERFGKPDLRKLSEKYGHIIRDL